MARLFSGMVQKRVVLGVVLSGLVSLGFAIVAIIAISLGFGSTRTIVLEAQTTGVEIRFTGRVNDWSLGHVVLCTPRQKIDRTSNRGSGRCDARRYIETTESDFRIGWDQNATVSVTSPSVGTLALDITGQSDLPNRTRVLLETGDWRSIGALTFYGKATVGDRLSSGETEMIIGGNFEARETSIWSDNTEVLKTGPIRRGESARIVYQTKTGSQLSEVFGHLTPLKFGEVGFAVGIVSAPGDVLLELGFFGAEKPTQIAPSWVDRALVSPLVLALAAILSAILSAGQLVSGGILSARTFATDLAASEDSGPSSKESSGFDDDQSTLLCSREDNARIEAG